MSLLDKYLHIKNCTSTQTHIKNCEWTGWGLLWSNTQSSGRGRKDRNWVSKAGGLYYSIQYPKPADVNIPALHLMGAAFLWCELIEKITNLSPTIKWPNDILVNSKKLAGFLGEVDQTFVYLGIGLNLNNSFKQNSTHKYAAPPTSVADETGKLVRRRSLLFRWMHSFKSAIADSSSKYFSPENIEERMDTIGKSIRFDSKVGEAVGLNEDGGLKVSVDNNIQTLFSNDSFEVV